MASLRRRTAAALLAVGKLAPAARAGTAEVAISGFAFDPPTLTIRAGTAVTWTNRDEEPHTGSSTDGRIDSPALDGDDRFSLAFTEPGSYACFCRLHPHMTGRVIVTP